MLEAGCFCSFKGDKFLQGIPSKGKKGSRKQFQRGNENVIPLSSHPTPRKKKKKKKTFHTYETDYQVYVVLWVGLCPPLKN